MGSDWPRLKNYLKTKSQHPEILEIIDAEESENLVFGFTEKEEEKKSTVVAYKVENGNADFLNSITAYWEDDYATLDITENGSTRTAKTVFHKSMSNDDGISPQASRSLCSTIVVGGGCDAAKNRFC